MRKLTDRQTINQLHAVARDVQENFGRTHQIEIETSTLVLMSPETYEWLCQEAGINSHRWKDVL